MTKLINTKILLSGAMIVAAAAVVIGATFAFFSDTETSTGNVLAAGTVDLKIDSECTYTRDGQQFECDGFGSWASTDLTTEKFYNFSDVKPGDWGENTISMLVDDNDAWACMRIDNMQNLENGLIDPEAEAGDVSDPQGELAENIHFTAWLDQGSQSGWQGSNEDPEEGDNIWQGEDDEPLLFSNVSGPASDVLGGVTYPLAEPGGSVIQASTTNYYGLLWCAGELTVDTVEDEITCDGSSMGNESQTDTLSADISFYAEQARNNEEFSCDNVEWPLPQATTTTGNGFSPVDTQGGFEWFAKAKVQEPNPASDFELQIGTDDSNNALFDQDDTIWVNEQTEDFTLTYDGAGNATLEVDDRPTVSFAVGSDSYGRIGITVRAPSDGTTSVENLSLDIAGLPTDNTSVSNGTSYLLIDGIDLSSGFVLTGQFTFDWGTLTNNGENQKVQFSID